MALKSSIWMIYEYENFTEMNYIFFESTIMKVTSNVEMTKGNSK